MLKEILKYKRLEVKRAKEKLSEENLIRRIEKSRALKHSLLSALKNRSKRIHLICELKKSSPSHGLLRKDFNLLRIARLYESAGASALSVLTDKRFFHGRPSFIRHLRPYTTLPILRKDFILGSYQIYETALLGADAVLLIARILGDTMLRRLIALGKELGLDALVEVHTKKELDRSLKAGARLIGINNRDLTTLKIDPSVAEKIVPRVPRTVTAIVESGIESRKDIERCLAAGAHCFLVGTALMKAADPKKKILELCGRN